MKSSIKNIIALGLLSLNLYGQKTPSSVSNADKKYEKYDYVDAIKTYEKVFSKGYKSEEMLKKLGNAYYFQADLDNAEKWYTELFSMAQSIEPEYYYRYAQSLKAVKKYTKADQVMNQFEHLNKEDIRSQLAANQTNYLEVIKANSGRYTLENAGINSTEQDYGSSFYNNKIIFATARDTGGLSKRDHMWNGQAFTNLYQAEIGADGALSNPTKFSKAINTKLHESTPVFTKDGKTMYFTRNNYNEGKRGYDDKNSEKRTTLLKLYKATYDGKNWTNVKELPFNSDQYNVAHPALSPDEKTLYFASNMPGSMGDAQNASELNSDLWSVKINDNDTYETPINLGREINTEGKETFPFISSENELFFASDGQPGLGGLDIYTAKSDGNTGFTKVQNIGEPINSSKDDFSYLIDTQTKYGYVSSNRAGGNGSDDIYRFKELKPIQTLCDQELSGTVTDLTTNEPIPFASVVLSDENMKYVREVGTDKDGKYDFGKIECGQKVYLKSAKEGYYTTETPVVIPNETGKTVQPLTLQSGQQTIKPGDDLAKALNIPIIYFDLDKSFIRPDAAVELAKVLVVLEEYPTMEIDVRSHTDCRQRQAYNMKLSERRAKSTIKWLVDHGIAKARLTGKGYGESQLVTDCPCEPTNVSSCSEAEHQLNRRSEFIVKKI